MKRWQLLAAILLAALLVAALVTYLVLSKQRSPESSTPTMPLSDIPMADVRSFAVRAATGAECRLERDDQNNWQLVTPISKTAEQNMVTWLLEDLLGAETSNAAPAAQLDLVRMGLEPPTATIALGLRGGGERTLQVGNYEPAYMAYLVRIGEQVYLFPADVIYRALNFTSVPPVRGDTTPTGAE